MNQGTRKVGRQTPIQNRNWQTHTNKLERRGLGPYPCPLVHLLYLVAPLILPRIRMRGNFHVEKLAQRSPVVTESKLQHFPPGPLRMVPNLFVVCQHGPFPI